MSSRGSGSRDVLKMAPVTHVGYSWIPFSIRVKEVTFAHIQVETIVFWPHELFSNMYHFYSSHFFTYVMPGVERIRKFWSSQVGNDFISKVLALML